MSISAVVNTYNEEQNIEECLKHLKPHVDEIVVVDMHSADRTEELAKKYTDRIWQHKYLGFVEPARNFAIEKAKSEWIFLIDADELVPKVLIEELKRLARSKKYDFYRVPRKNVIFGRWIKHSGWWPDHQIRFFRKGAVTWNNEIHSIPITRGMGKDLEAEENFALIHPHYKTVSQYLERMNRYTTQEAHQLVSEGYHFSWRELLKKPANEFLTRFFTWEGYRDGVHGLALSLLQAMSFFVVELKVWEQQEFKEETHPDFLEDVGKVGEAMWRDISYWYFTKVGQSKDGVEAFIYKVRRIIRM